MDDLTIVFYSANRLPDAVADNFRRHLVEMAGKTPIISVTQKPVELGRNICVGDIGQSYYNLFKQMLLGVREVKTPYVALAEDDTLYVPNHFEQRPSDDKTVAYNRNMWFLDTKTFWTKKHTGNFGLIASTENLLGLLEQRFERFPEEMLPRYYQKWFWMEFGQDDRLGFKNANTEVFETGIPLITFAYYGATYGKPKRRLRTSSEVSELPHWGDAQKLRQKLEGSSNPS